MKCTDFRGLDGGVEAGTAPPRMARLSSRRAFYAQHGGHAANTRHGFGRAELHFLAWALRRGAFGGRGLHASHWWSNVNGDLVRHSENAAQLLAVGRPYLPELPLPVRAWLDYLAAPSAVAWYRAHNASVVCSYLARVAEAKLEPVAEQRFMRQVLIRLLGAQALVEGGRHVRCLGRLFDPKGQLIPLLLRFDVLYPQHYPLSSSTNSRSWGRARAALEATELTLWRPALAALFHHGARWLQLPELTSMVHRGELHYPEPAPKERSAGLVAALNQRMS